MSDERRRHDGMAVPTAMLIAVVVVLLARHCARSADRADETAAVMAMSISLSRESAKVAEQPAPRPAVKPIAPKLEPAPPPLKARAGEPQHSHKCGRCGNEFWHGESSFGNAEAHRCPRCGFGPNWQIHQRGGNQPAPIRAVYPSPNAMPRFPPMYNLSPFGANCPIGGN